VALRKQEKNLQPFVVYPRIVSATYTQTRIKKRK
jgi:hypothetical protein